MQPPMPTPPLFLFFLLLATPAAGDFLLNGLDPSSVARYGDATVEPGSRTLSLTNASEFSVGRALYKTRVATRDPARAVLPFHVSFLFSIAPIRGTLPGHGIVFLFSPSPGTRGATAAQHLGLFNRTTDGDRANRVLAIEFDLFQNEEFGDIDANHVGVDLNSLSSVEAHPAGYWPDDPTNPSSSSSSSFVNLSLNDGSNYQAWVDYVGGRLNVTMAPVGWKKPRRPLISRDLDLSDVFLDEMYVGFCAATGELVERHRILAWSYSNYNSSLSDALDTSRLPNFLPPPEEPGAKLGRGAIAAISGSAAAILTLALLLLWRRRKRREDSGRRRGCGGDGRGERGPMEEWELEYWPHRIGYREISAATDGFSDRNLVGCGGNGRVYRGVLGGAQVAVKLFFRSSGEEERQFLAEVSSLGRLKHRNLVALQGWCRNKEGGGELILVYDYMENGSLDRWLFTWQAGAPALGWEERVRVLRDVAAGVAYLHEGWEARVLHRDIKSSNVMLDGAMNGRLGDFGLARLQPHGRPTGTSRVVGSVGYMAPEVVRTGKASAATDVYGFGVLVLETVCGRRAVEEGRSPLVDWVWKLVERREEMEAVDPRLRVGGDGDAALDVGEAARLLRLGLTCASADPAGRPTMRQVVRALEQQNGGEAGEAGLLERKLRGAEAMAPTTAMWVCAKRQQGRSTSGRRWAGSGGVENHHLTYEELRQSMSCSASLSTSDLILEGR